MAAITHPRLDELEGTDEVVRGGRARAAAVRSRGGSRVEGARPSLFAGDGKVRRPAPTMRLTSVPLVAHDDLASLPSAGAAAAPARPAARSARNALAPAADPRHVRLVGAPLVAVAEPGRTARPAGSVTATRPSPATYRRRRLVAAALVLGALLTGSWVLGALGGGPLAASEGESSSTAREAVVLQVQPVSRSTYVVEPGDTLWSIARALQPEGDVRPVVDALATTRQGRPLEVGETIVLP